MTWLTRYDRLRAHKHSEVLLSLTNDTLLGGEAHVHAGETWVRVLAARDAEGQAAEPRGMHAQTVRLT